MLQANYYKTSYFYIIYCTTMNATWLALSHWNEKNLLKEIIETFKKLGIKTRSSLMNILTELKEWASKLYFTWPNELSAEESEEANNSTGKDDLDMDEKSDSIEKKIPVDKEDNTYEEPIYINWIIQNPDKISPADLELATF